MPGHNRAQEKERGGDTALGHAETPETMLSRDDGNGGERRRPAIQKGGTKAAIRTVDARHDVNALHHSQRAGISY